MYCGDETGSFIGDVGSHTSRFGYGGEDNPKYVAPSYMVEMEEENDKPAGGDDEMMMTTKKYRIPSSCYQGRLASEIVRPIMRMPWLGESSPEDDDDSGEKKGSDKASEETKNNQEEQRQRLLFAPQIDPNAYLQQGDCVKDWDALEQLWQTSFDVLRARDTRKHTIGGTPYDKSRSGSGSGNSKVQSSTVRGQDSREGGRCAHPILAVTPGMTHRIGGTGDKYAAAVQREQHIKLTEFLMESMEAPAVFLAPTPMLSSFCFGRQTALVVDVGASGCRVTPVVDGLLLKHAQRRNGRGGDWLGNVQWRAQLDEKVVLRPRYQLRKAVSAMATKSPFLYRWAMQDLMYEFRTSPHINLTEWCVDQSVPFLSSGAASSPDSQSSDDDDEEDDDDDEDEKEEEEDGDGDDEENKEGNNSDSMDIDETITGNKTFEAGSTYELPDGTHIDLNSKMGKDLCRIPELLFTDEVPYVMNETMRTGVMSEHHTLSNLPLHKLIFASLSAVGDGDIRKDLAANIILTGGSSLFPKLAERLSMEVPRVVPNAYKCRVIASRNSVERSCSAWVGASILTSLGSFQQLWLSRTEYEEYGAAIAVQRFP